MAIDGVSGRTSYLGSQLISIKSQLDTLTQQLSSGKKSTTYAGLGFDAATATGLRAQIASIASYADTATNLNTRINVVNLSLQGIADAASEVKSAAAGASLTLDNTGQTAGQQTAMASFTQTIALLNSTSGGRYLFSGRATDTPSTASADAILNGTTTQAGLRQMIDERRQADLGASGMGRVAVNSPTTTSVVISEDATESPFGLKLNAISSTLTGSTVAAPPNPAPVLPAAPSSMSIDLGATNPNDGEKVKLTFTLPDGTNESITLTASSTVPTPEGSFAIGADSAATTRQPQRGAQHRDRETRQHVAGRRVGGHRRRKLFRFVTAAARRWSAVRFRDVAGQRNDGEHRVVVHRRRRHRSRARHGSRRHRYRDHGAVRRARQRGCVPRRGQEHGGVRRGHHEHGPIRMPPRN